ncbi:TRC40/GET3/ArsA family transport-energizing ATPase [Marinobacter nanhaiticus D15-8W]|uniref:arsenite-transporting ATPase n=1 Tax=Marinobacter nanhaiticus D15-8W TaxID=626887 RepID=N6X5Z8_9GAMM|nr:ArsA family ATPase [Marinobacter nanhaiticus]ENO16523.1 ArsA family ATPase [Marinobacter nanhaiticus D15-8W]BES72314.1 TRC40/GET3/ArsA family transport-energizing ATPase [Marinobacter nanhaiticus D15-8W]
MLDTQRLLDIQKLIGSKRLLMVGGKGGVGKTTVSAALAVAAAEAGRRVLLVSTDPAHSLADAFDRAIGGMPTTLWPNLTALELDPDTEVDAYLERVFGQMRRYVGPDQVNELQRQLRLSSQSPGAQEAALLERMSRLIGESEKDYDLLIFDTAPTGHTLRLLSLPEVMAAWTDGLLKHNKRSEKLGKALAHLTPGRSVDNPLTDPKEHALEDMDPRSRELTETLLARQRLFQRTRRVLNNAEHTAFLFVLTPERLPILETERAVNSLRGASVPVAGAIVNRLLPDNEDSRFWAHRRERQQRHLDDIDQRLGTMPQLRLPLLEDDIQGLDNLLAFSRHLMSKP